MMHKQGQARFYQEAKRPEDLPWHSEEPNPLLLRALENRGSAGRALDLGCGAGVFSVLLAQRGYEVIGLDFMPKAIEMATSRAAEAGVEVSFVQTDLFAWNTPHRFDLILDSGCLHSLIGGNPRAYRDRILAWLAPDGDYVLGHFGKRHRFDWRPIGPDRRNRETLVEFFAPDLTEVDYVQELITGIALPIGPTALGQGFWFRRAAT